MKRTHQQQDLLPQASLCAVFLVALHTVIHLFRIFVITFSGDPSLIRAQDYNPLLRSFLLLTILSAAWTLTQALPAIWARTIDTTAVIFMTLLLASTGTVLYTWLLWQSIQIATSRQ
ncbi:hypothetical protein BH11VER1_BH11VER1_00050 [soil metagenome]